MNNPRIRITAFVLLAVALVAGGVLALTRPWRSDDNQTATPTPVVEGEGNGMRLEVSSPFGAQTDSGDALRIRLSAGQSVWRAVERPLVAAGSALSAETIQSILARLPELTLTPTDTQEFRLPDESLPPPRPGQTINDAFPPPVNAGPPESVPTGPLEVLRFAPEGDVPIAPFVSLTFNQPMVPLTTREQLATTDAPVRLTPALPGVWRWLGARTLRFEYVGNVDRLPMATEYSVEVPAGVRSQTGGVLAQTVTWRFRTPTPKVESFYPQGEPQPLDPVFFVLFDQRVDPAAVLNTLHLRAGARDVVLRLANADEVQADSTVSDLAAGAPTGRWLAFRAASPLPADTAVTVTVGPNVPSAEGALTSDRAETFSLHTYAPLRLVNHTCGWDVCRPLQPFSLEFNNPIDPQAFDVAQITVEPELRGAVVSLYGNGLSIQGMTQGRTTYTVRVAGTVRDVFGQALGQEAAVKFEVGSAEPALSGPDHTLVTLDPSAPNPLFSVYSINYDRLAVQLYAVSPADWPAYLRYRQEYYNNTTPPMPPGRLVQDETIQVGGVADVLTETGIDLSPALEGEFGHVIVVVQPPAGLLQRDQYRPIVQAWVQVTQIGVDAILDHDQMLVWTTALRDGAPLSDVSINLAGASQSVTTGSDGTVRFDLPAGNIQYLIAQRNGDTAILPSTDYIWENSGWQRQPITDEARWYVFDDRAMYRPGEDVHIKGWLRRIVAGQTGDVGLLGGDASIRYQVFDAQSNQLFDGSIPVNELGGFDLAFTLPDNANLGDAWINFTLQGGGAALNGRDAAHYFQIQEFRRPEFEVTARNETSGPYFAGDSATVAVAANYYAGGPLPNADVTWTVTTRPGSYSPPNWPDFIFGTWQPWWIDYGPRSYAFESSRPFGPEFDNGTVETFTGLTDAAGNHYLRLDFEGMPKPQPVTVMAEATVTDINRQAWAATTALLVHPADLYVGMRSERYFVTQGTPLPVDVVVVDIDGQAVAGREVTVRAARLAWQYRAGAWGEQEAAVETCAQTSTDQPVTCTFATDEGGEYRFVATVTDDQGRVNQSQFTRWVSGGQSVPSRDVAQEQVTLIPNQDSYQPGDVAEILVQSPFSPAEGLLTVGRDGILRTERFQMTSDTTTLRVPIEDAHIPNLSIQVDVVGAAPRTADDGSLLPGVPPRPAYAGGQLSLNIPPLRRTLRVAATLQESRVAPGGETLLDVVVADADGRPVTNAELAVVVVDEAILALSNYQLADPLATFYAARYAGVSSYYGRASLVLANPLQLLAQGDTANAVTAQATQTVERAALDSYEVMKGAEAALPPALDGSSASEPIRVRSDFNPLAIFAPSVRTDAQGRAQVLVRVPDNLTRYRVMVAAVAGEKQFGSAESTLTARLPLMLRPAAPRFLNFGDVLQLPVIIQNQTDAPLEVDVVVAATNLTLTDTAGRRVTVPANDRVEVRFPAAALNAGVARLQFAAVSGDYADAALIELPVYTPATTEAFATYGVIDEGATAQPILAPAGVFPQFGGLEIDTSATALQALTDAVVYLVDYPFAGTEQLASRILAISALRTVLGAFSAENLPPPAALEEAVRRDIDRLQQLQSGDGGFPVWQRGRESEPFYTIHAIHALQRAQSEGFEVSPAVWQSAQTYLREIESHYPAWYDNQTRWTLSAYALYVRQLMGDRDQAKAARLLDTAGLEELPLEAVAWVWQVLNGDSAYSSQNTAILRHLQNRVVETAGAATFTTDYSEQAYLVLSSERRTDGIILDALIAAAPESDLIPKVVSGLLGGQVRGRWGNTQENVFILLALDRYFKTFEAQTPDFVARLWLGQTYVAEHTYAGRTTERHRTDIPMRYLVDNLAGATQDLILSKDGPGRLYYRLGLQYAPTDLKLAPLDQGFVVQRAYAAVDDPADVRQDADGVWHIRAGARVRVTLIVVADSRRTHVALIDPLPAGLEIVNPALAVSPGLPTDPAETARPFWWWWWTWYDHQNLRDEQAEIFATVLYAGIYDYSYVARATTPGTFVTPPARAEELYAPEVFGRTASATVIIEDPAPGLPSGLR